MARLLCLAARIRSRLSRRRRRRAAWLFGTLGVAAGAAVLWQAAGARWRSSSRAVARRLAASQGPDDRIGPRYSERDLAGLPAPVARYFRAALREGQPIVTRVRLAQRGAFRSGESERDWRRFTARQEFVTRPPGFLWDARIDAAPGLRVFVRDAYVEGTGAMRAAFAGLVPILGMEGTPEIAAGALHRYLAEAVWFPTALLPSQGVSWTPLDKSTARATRTDGATTVSLDFGFRPDGLIATAFTRGRYREERGAAVPRPWLCTISRYEERNGMKIPLRASAGWRLEGGDLPYFRGTITSIDHDVSPAEAAREMGASA